MRDLKVNNDPELAEDYLEDDDSDNNHDHHDNGDDDEDGPSPPGGGTNSLVSYDDRHPLGDPGSLQEGWLSWHYNPEEVEAERDKEWLPNLYSELSLSNRNLEDGTNAVDLDTISESSTENYYESEIMRAKWISQINKAVAQWAKDIIARPPGQEDLKAVLLMPYLEVNGVQVPQGSYVGLQHNAAIPKDFTWMVPKPLVIVVHINGHTACTLLDSGSLGDFVSTALADQLKVHKTLLKKPLPLQLAVQGSRSRVNWGTTVKFKYQSINEERYFDIANLSNYNLILGAP